MNDAFEDLTVEKFVNMIRGIVKDVLKESQLNVERCYNGIIISLDEENDAATVDIGNNVLNSIPNNTGLVLGDTLSVGNAVRVYASSPTLTDAYIGIKLN